MKIKYLIPFLILIPVIIIQLTIVPFISIEEVVPDLLLIALVYFSIAQGQLFGTSLGACYGLVFDYRPGGDDRTEFCHLLTFPGIISFQKRSIGSTWHP